MSFQLQKATQAQRDYYNALAKVCKKHGIPVPPASDANVFYHKAIKIMLGELKAQGIRMEKQPRYGFNESTGEIINIWTGKRKEP